MKLIGSIASPYVRRLRIQLGSRPYEFETISVLSNEGQTLLKKYTPTKRVPLLIDGETVIWDSLLISEYLNGEGFSLEVKKDLTLINEMSDSGIQLYQLRLFKTDEKDEGTFSKNNLSRIENVLDYFEARDISNWGIVEQWLFCTLEWFSFRDVYDWKTNHPKLESFVKASQDQPFVKETAPN
ncbi:unnamed protein product [Chrysoparadoxa australica]